MDLYESIRSKGIYSRPSEDDLYAEVLREITMDIRLDGIWAKALAESDMDNDRARAAYIKLRVQALRIETNDYIAELGRIAADELEKRQTHLDLMEEQLKSSILKLDEEIQMSRIKLSELEADLVQRSADLELKTKHTIAEVQEKAKEEVWHITNRLEITEDALRNATQELNFSSVRLKETNSILSNTRIVMWGSLAIILASAILIYSGNAILIFSR